MKLPAGLIKKPVLSKEFTHVVATPSVPQLTVRKVSRVFGGSGLTSPLVPNNGWSELAKPGAPDVPPLTTFAQFGAPGIGPFQP